MIKNYSTFLKHKYKPFPLLKNDIIFLINLFIFSIIVDNACKYKYLCIQMVWVGMTKRRDGDGFYSRPTQIHKF
jgi:hypothetical protein